MNDSHSLRSNWRTIAAAAIAQVEEWSDRKAPGGPALHVRARNLWALLAADPALKEDEALRTKSLAVMEFARARALDAAHGDTAALFADGAPEPEDPKLKALLDPALQAELHRLVVAAQPHLAALGALEADALAIANRLRVTVAGPRSRKDRLQAWALEVAEVFEAAFGGAAETAAELPLVTSLLPSDREKLKPRLLIGLTADAVEDELTLDMARLKESGVSLLELGRIFYPEYEDERTAKDRVAKRLKRLRQPGVDEK